MEKVTDAEYRTVKLGAGCSVASGSQAATDDWALLPIRIVRLGTPRATGEGVRLGTVRRPPRGVKKQDFARLDYFDVWMPDLAPSAPLFKFATSEPLTDKRWAVFARKYSFGDERAGGRSG